MEKSPSRSNDFQFIREKIYRLHSAIMYSMSNELIKIPNSIVTVLRIDEEGQLWFQCKAPILHIRHYEQNFPARLHFFRKGYKYFVEVSGSTMITKTQNTSNTWEKSENGTLILKMNINQVEYTEPQVRKKNWFDLVMEDGYNWLLRTIALPRSTKSFFDKLQHHNR